MERACFCVGLVLFLSQLDHFGCYCSCGNIFALDCEAGKVLVEIECVGACDAMFFADRDKKTIIYADEEGVSVEMPWSVERNKFTCQKIDYTVKLPGRKQLFFREPAGDLVVSLMDRTVVLRWENGRGTESENLLYHMHSVYYYEGDRTTSEGLLVFF